MVGLASGSVAEDYRPLYAPQLFVYGRSASCLMSVQVPFWSTFYQLAGDVLPGIPLVLSYVKRDVRF